MCQKTKYYLDKHETIRKGIYEILVQSEDKHIITSNILLYIKDNMNILNDLNNHSL